jgi:hypothetical protein
MGFFGFFWVFLCFFWFFSGSVPGLTGYRVSGFQEKPVTGTSQKLARRVAQIYPGPVWQGVGISRLRLGRVSGSRVTHMVRTSHRAWRWCLGICCDRQHVLSSCFLVNMTTAVSTSHCTEGRFKIRAFLARSRQLPGPWRFRISGSPSVPKVCRVGYPVPSRMSFRIPGDTHGPDQSPSLAMVSRNMLR